MKKITIQTAIVISSLIGMDSCSRGNIISEIENQYPGYHVKEIKIDPLGQIKHPKHFIKGSQLIYEWVAQDSLNNRIEGIGSSNRRHTTIDTK